MAHTYDAPLSPALKQYLQAFDAHLLAKNGIEVASTRAVMVERLFTATGLRPREPREPTPYMRVPCEGCGHRITPGYVRCRTCAQRARRARERLAP